MGRHKQWFPEDENKLVHRTKNYALVRVFEDGAKPVWSLVDYSTGSPGGEIFSWSSRKKNAPTNEANKKIRFLTQDFTAASIVNPLAKYPEEDAEETDEAGEDTL